MRGICPKCFSELEGPTKNSRWFCSTDGCSVQYVRFDHDGNVKEIIYTGVAPCIGFGNHNAGSKGRFRMKDVRVTGKDMGPVSAFRVMIPGG